MAPLSKRGLAEQARVWVAVGLQSFGGGAATLASIQREFVYRRRWIAEADFMRDWSLCQLAPGINLFALAVLIGRRLGGRRGVLVAVGGLLVPSLIVTILLTAAYSSTRQSAEMQSALKAVVPAVAAVGIATTAQMGRPLVREARKSGPIALASTLALGVVVAVVYVRWRPPVPALLFGSAAIGAASRWARSRGTA